MAAAVSEGSLATAATATTAAAAEDCAPAEVSPEVLCPTHNSRLKIFEDYEFLAAVGSGAFGKVLKVRHRASGQPRACKVLSSCSGIERGLVDTEVAVLKTLNHPHVVRLHEVFIESGNEQRSKAYLVTELFEGGDLLFRINYHYQTLGVNMKEGHVAYMMRQILSAAMYCHHRGIVHRDVKPDNVLFIDAGAGSPLKLIDFGLAGFAERLRESAREVSVPRSNSLGRLAKLLPAAGARWCHVRKQMMQRAGTAFYMAPEMISVGCYDQKADMFSIGAILCELLTGWHPFYAPEVDDTQSVHAKITAPRSVRLPRQTFASVSQEACDLCQRLLEKDPRRRLSAGQALAHAWFRDPSKPSPFGGGRQGGGGGGGLSAETFVALRRYRASHRFRRAALLLLVAELAESQFQAVRAAFLALDARGDGLLSSEELAEGARSADVSLEEGEAEALVAVLGGASGQRAGYREFLAALVEHHVKFDLAQLRGCFQKFDSQGRGCISFEDVERVLACREGTAKISRSEWEEIFGPPPVCPAAEGGESRTLSFEGFLAVMQSPESSRDILSSAALMLQNAPSVAPETLQEVQGMANAEAPATACPFC